jgi:hypothetical protein
VVADVLSRLDFPFLSVGDAAASLGVALLHCSSAPLCLLLVPSFLLHPFVSLTIDGDFYTDPCNPS